MNNIQFKDRLFNLCYNCGWGEQGVQEVNLTHEQAFNLIKTMASQENAGRWAKEEDTRYEFNIYRYMVADCDFEESEWEGSQDY